MNIIKFILCVCVLRYIHRAELWFCVWGAIFRWIYISLSEKVLCNCKFDRYTRIYTKRYKNLFIHKIKHSNVKLPEILHFIFLLYWIGVCCPLCSCFGLDLCVYTIWRGYRWISGICKTMASFSNFYTLLGLKRTSVDSIQHHCKCCRKVSGWMEKKKSFS